MRVFCKEIMDTLVLSKEKLKDFLKSLSDVRLIAPISESGKTRFEEIENPETVNVVLTDYTASPKKVMFPQTETMFAFGCKDGSVDIADDEEVRKTVVFGLRPCDAKSFIVLDPLFKKDYVDPYYARRRNATVLIGLACQEPTNRCFCGSLGGSPTSTEGLDVLFTDIGDEYFVEVLSDRAKELLSSIQSIFKEPSEEQKNKKKKAAEEAFAKLRRHVDFKGLDEKLPRIFEHGIWKELADRCLGCGICTYMCPTCHCFDIQDEGTPEGGRRIRVWDSCMYPEFTVHASGENPRKDRSERLRNRMFDKFSYYPQNWGLIGCVGCGRCIEFCPVNIDLIEILNKIEQINA